MWLCELISGGLPDDGGEAVSLKVGVGLREVVLPEEAAVGRQW